MVDKVISKTIIIIKRNYISIKPYYYILNNNNDLTKTIVSRPGKF